MARIFALPLIVVTGSRKRIQIEGALPDIAAVTAAVCGKFITLSLRRDQAENPHQKVPVPPPFTNEGGSTKPI